MLESIASAILSKVLGDYVKGFEAKNLKFSWNGELSLTDLELSTTALDNFDIPIRIKAGSIGKLHLLIPWRELGTKPSIVRIERVYIILGPKPLSDYDEATAKKREQMAKERKLQYVELVKQTKNQNIQKATDNDSFVKRLVTTVVNNLQIYIDKIHIRYEDDQTNPERPFCAGVTLEHLHAQSTDRNWKPMIPDQTEPLIYKLITLKNLAAYWNPYDSFLQYSSIQEMRELMEILIYTDDHDPEHVYVIEPVSSELKVVINKSDLPDMLTPKAKARCTFDRISIAVRESQYNDFVSLMKRMIRYRKGSKFRKFRPKTTVKEDPKAWWGFVGNAVVSEIQERKRKWTWEYIKQRKVDKLAYIKLWKKAKKKKKFTEQETNELKRLEEKLSFEDILFFRTLTDIYLRKEASSENKNKPKSGFTGWISGWFSKNSDDDTLEIPYLNVKVGDNEWKEIYEAIQYQEKEDTSGANKPPPDWVQIQADFMLGAASATLQNEKGEPIANVAFEALQLGLLLRDKWTSFKAELDSLELTDYFTKKTRFPQIITPQRRNQKLFDFRLELNPVGQNFDTGVYLVTKPLNIVYNYPLIHRVISFIVDPLSSGPSKKKKSGINLKSESQLDFLLKLKKTLYLDLDIHAPNILMPENVLEDTAPMLVAILGQFKMNTDLSQMNRKDLQNALKTQVPDPDSEEYLKNFYDSYNLKVSSLQILLATSAQRSSIFKEVERNNITTDHLLEPIDAEVTLRLCKINAEALSNVRLDSTLPTLRLKISAERLSTLINLILAVVDELETEKNKSAPKIIELPPDSVEFNQEDNIEKFTQNIIDISVPEASKTNAELIQEEFKGKVFQAELNIPEAVVVLYRQEQDENVDFAVLMLNGIGLEIVKHKYEFTLNANLNNLIIEDLLQPYGKDYRYLAHSTTLSDDLFNNFIMDKVLDTEANLILISYTNISKESPSYDNTDQFLHCEFNALSLVVNRHTVAILINFFSSITVRKKDAVEPVQADNQTIMQANAGKKVDPNHTTIRITVEIKGITLLLNGDDGADKALPLARAALSNSAFELNVKDTGLAIEGHLGNLNIKDLRSSPKYPTILDIKGDHMVDFMFTITPCQEFAGIKDEYNIYIKVSNVRLIYIERFVSELMTYLAVFGTIFEATKQKVTEYLGSLYQNPTKVFKYCVELIAPTVIVPQSSTSHKVLLMDLGKISIQNSFTEIKRYSSMLEEIAIKLKHASITTGSMLNAEVHPTDDLVDQDNKILNDLTAVLCVERALDPKAIQHEMPDVRVNIHIPSIALTASAQQLKFLLDMWSENLLQTPSDQQIAEVRKKNATNMLQKANTAKTVPISVWMTLALHIEIPLISLTLLDLPLHLKKGNIPMDAALPEPLVQLELTFFEMIMTTTSAEAMVLDVDVSTIKVYDMRPNSPVVAEFQTFIAPITRHDEASRSQLVVKYLRHSNGKQEVIINNDRFRAILIPEVILRMQTIIMGAQQQLMATLEKRGKLVAMLNPEVAHQAELNAAMAKNLTVSEAQKQVGMLMRLTITKPQFCIVEDLTKEDSKVFIIHSNLTLNMANNDNHMKMSLTLQGTEIFKTAMNIRSTIGAVEIMEPFDTSIEMKSDPHNFDIVIDIKPFRVIFSYNDVKILMNAAQQWAVMRDVTATVEDTTSLGWDTTDETSKLGSEDGPSSFSLNSSTILDEGSDVSEESDQWEDPPPSDAGPLSEDSTATTPGTDPSNASLSAPSTPRQQSQPAIVVDSPSKDESKDEPMSAPSTMTKKKDKKEKAKEKSKHKKEREKEKKEKKEREKEKKENDKKESDKKKLYRKSSEIRSQPISAQNTPVKNKDGGPDSQPLSLEKAGKQPSTSSIVSASNEDGPISRTGSGPKLEVPQGPVRNQKVVISPHSFEILFIDDVKGIDVPLFRVFVTKWFGHVLDWSTQLQLAAALQMHIVYFNSDLDTWEPFVEPWEVELRKTGIETEISSRELMNVNITKNLMRTVQSAMKAWTADLGGLGPKIEELPEHPLTKSQKEDSLTTSSLHRNVRSTESTLSITRHEYYIQNLTGVPMSYRCGKDDPVVLKSRKKQPLVSNGRGNRRNSTLTNTINNRLSKNKRMVVTLNVEGYGEIKNANIQNVGKFAAVSESGKRILYTVSYHKGSKIVTVTSPVLVENKTTYPIQVLVEIKDSDSKPIELPAIPPGKSEPIPITTVSDAVLRFRPVDGYQWSRVSCYVPKLEASIRQIQCEPRSAKDRPFLFTINVDKDFNQELKDYHVITLTTPLILENLLPTTMEYKVCDKKSGALLHLGELAKGAQTPVHYYEAQQELALTIRIPGFDWSEKEPIVCNKSKDLSDNIIVDDKNNKSLYLSIDNTESDGTRKITIYCPYWIINRTGLPLAFGEHREELAPGLEDDATETWELSGEPCDCFFEDFFNSAPQLFSLRDSSNKLHVKIANSVWSRGIGLQNASHTTAYLQMPEKRKDGDREAGRLYELSVVEYSAKNEFWRTKVVAFAPRFVLLNKMNKTLFCKQNGTMDVFTLLPNERVPFHWTNNNISEKKMQIRLDEGDCTWSTGFSLVDFGFFPVQMLDEETFEPYILQVKFQIENGIVYVVFTQDAKNEVYMIQNQLDVDILVTQKDSGLKPVKLTAGKSQPWGWFDPDGTRQVEIKLPNYPHRISHHIDKIKDHNKAHKYKDHEGKWKRAYIRIKAVNGTRILQVRIYRKKAQMRKDKQKEEEKETNKFVVNLKGVGLSMINEKPEELLYLTMEGIRVELLTFPSKSSIEVNIKDCQIDNQIVTTYHPVLLYSPSETPPQFFKFTFIKNTRHTHLTYIEYLSVLMREVNICVDEELVLKMLSFVDVLIEGMQEKSPTEIEEVKPLESSITEASYAEMIYTELFHLNPIKLNFTFTAIKGDDEESKQNKNNIARIILKIPDKLIPNVDNAPLNLNALLMSHSFITKQELTARLAEHYRTKFMRQLYKILGSFDALGNPVSFVKNMGAGVHDLFYEPAKGMTVSAKEFGKGLGRGAASLVKKSVYAIFNSASKITGSISKGVAILSMDNQYQQKRQVEKFRQRPRNAIEGIGYGLKDLGTGIIKGLYGIVEQPVKGGMAEGAKGVFKGIGRGFVGVVIKPTVGGIDFVQRTMEGVKNTTTLDEKVATRKRPPRYLNSSTKLRVYSAYEAQGQDMLHQLGNSGEYWDHIYWYHEEFDRKRVLLVSDKAVFIIKKKKIEWRHSFANLIAVEPGPEPNQLTLTVSKKSLLESSPDKTVNCQSEEQANKVYKTLIDLWDKFKHMQEQNAMSIESNTNKK